MNIVIGRVGLVCLRDKVAACNCAVAASATLSRDKLARVTSLLNHVIHPGQSSAISHAACCSDARKCLQSVLAPTGFRYYDPALGLGILE